MIIPKRGIQQFSIINTKSHLNNNKSHGAKIPKILIHFLAKLGNVISISTIESIHNQVSSEKILKAAMAHLQISEYFMKLKLFSFLVTMSDPVTNELRRQIESRRSGMAIMYGDRLDKLVDSIKAEDHKDHAYYAKYEKMQFLLKLKSVQKGLQQRHLDTIEDLLYRTFNKPKASVRVKGKPIVAVVDLTVDDDDDLPAPIPASSSIDSEAPSSPTDTFHSCASVPASPLPVDRVDSPALKTRPENVAPPVIEPFPIPDVGLPTASSLGLPEIELPQFGSLNIQNKQQPQRRKSINQRPESSRDLPSIYKYQIKHNVLPPPSRYAKPTENESETPRKIIDLPYKPVRAKPEAYDPTAEAIKLAGIQERIYAKNYLKINETRKGEIEEEVRQEIEKEKTVLEEDDRRETETEHSALEKEVQQETETETVPSRPNKVRTAHNGKANGVMPANSKPSATTPPNQVTKKRGRPKKHAAEPEPGKLRSRSKSVCYKEAIVDVGENSNDFIIVNARRRSNMKRNKSFSGMANENDRNESPTKQPKQRGVKRLGQSKNNEKGDDVNDDLISQEPPMKLRRKSMSAMTLRGTNRMNDDDDEKAPDHGNDSIDLKLAEMMQETNPPVASPTPKSTDIQPTSTRPASTSVETSRTTSSASIETSSTTNSSASGFELDKKVILPPDDQDDRIEVIYGPKEIKRKPGQKGRGKAGSKSHGKPGRGKPEPKPKSQLKSKPKGRPGRKPKIDRNSRQVAPPTSPPAEILAPLPENFFDDFECNDDGDDDGESLLVEIPGSTRPLKKREVYVPKHPRGKIPHVVVKIEPQDK